MTQSTNALLIHGFALVFLCVLISPALGSPSQTVQQQPQQSPKTVQQLTESYIRDIEVAQTGGGADACQALVNKYADNTTKISLMGKSFTGQDEFGRGCRVAQSGVQTSQFLCSIVFVDETEEMSVVRCNTSGVFLRSAGGTGAGGQGQQGGFNGLLSMTVLKWNVFTQKLISTDTSVADVQMFLNGYLTNAEKFRWRFSRAMWEGGFEAASEFIADNCTVSAPNMFLRPVFVSGKQQIRQLHQTFLGQVNFNASSVKSYDMVYGNNVTSAVRVEIEFTIRATGLTIHRTIYSIANFGQDGKLYSVEVIVNKPLMFWDLTPFADSQNRTSSQTSSLGSLPGQGLPGPFGRTFGTHSPAASSQQQGYQEQPAVSEQGQGQGQAGAPATQQPGTQGQTQFQQQAPTQSAAQLGSPTQAQGSQPQNTQAGQQGLLGSQQATVANTSAPSQKTPAPFDV